MKPKSRPLKLFCLGTILFFIDFITKWFTHHFLPLIYNGGAEYPYGGKAVFHHFFGISFSINHATNNGAAWGILSGFSQALFILRIIVITALFCHILFFNRKRFLEIPLIFILFGALGNVFDYFLYGHVVDMFYFQFWGYSFPIFNVADTFIFLGIASLSLLSLFQKHDKLPIDSATDVNK